MDEDPGPPSRAMTRRSRSLRPALAFLIIAVLIAIAVVDWRRDSAPPLPQPPGPAVIQTRGVPAPAGSLTPAPASTTGVFLEPGDGRPPILDEIAAARRSVDLEVYLLSDETILKALEEAQRRGVAVRVILEEHPFGGQGNQPTIFARLQDAGIAVRWSNPLFRFTHIKTMVVDDEVALIMNLNLTASSFSKNREFAVITTEPEAVRTAAAIFEADWTRGPEPDPGPLVVSPTNSRHELLALIDGATTSLEVYAEVLRDPETLAALGDAAGRGVEVRVIVSPNADFSEARAQLVAAGVDLRLLSRLYVHAKVVVADGERAFIGSQNFSATSLDLNRELGIIVDDPVSLARIQRIFETDFRAAKPEETP